MLAWVQHWWGCSHARARLVVTGLNISELHPSGCFDILDFSHTTSYREMGQLGTRGMTGLDSVMGMEPIFPVFKVADPQTFTKIHQFTATDHQNVTRHPQFEVFWVLFHVTLIVLNAEPHYSSVILTKFLDLWSRNKFYSWVAVTVPDISIIGGWG